tara:strand:- start:262 stop:732 length:471 start_codon:yes stop_codon:yes gene_type:complete
MDHLEAIEIIDNFLSEKSCKDLIAYYENNEQMQRSWYTTKSINITKINQFDYLFNNINRHTLKKNCKIDWIEIVKWGDNSSQSLHYDTSSKETVYSSISYLNHNYVGGQTFFEEGTIISPKEKRMLFFNGMHYKHGVMPVKKGPRYTLAAWYKIIN